MYLIPYNTIKNSSNTFKYNQIQTHKRYIHTIIKQSQTNYNQITQSNKQLEKYEIKSNHMIKHNEVFFQQMNP